MKRLIVRIALTLATSATVGAMACTSTPESTGVEPLLRGQQALVGPGSQSGSGGRNGKGGGRHVLAKATPPIITNRFHPVSPPASGPGIAAGFRHTLSKALPSGSMSPLRTETGADGTTRHFTDTGVFVEMANGYSSFSLNGHGSLDKYTPFSNNAETHNSRVKSYFLAAGLPASQIGDVSIATLMREGGTASLADTQRELLGYMTILRRVVDGVPVATSCAWAQFNAEGRVVAERVWWPPLAESTRTQLAEFSAVISNAARKSEFNDRLPRSAQTSNGRLVIHHALPLGEKWYERVTWDVSIGNVDYSFDINGQELRIVGWTDEWEAPPSAKR